MLKTMQDLNPAALEQDCVHSDSSAHAPPSLQSLYGRDRQPHLRLNALPQSCVASWVEQKLREDPAGCELSESSPEAKSLRKLLLERAKPLSGSHSVRVRQAASYLLCLQQVPEALPLFIEDALGTNPEDACVAALFRAPQADGPTQDARRAYIEQGMRRLEPPRQLFIPSGFGSESARLALVPLLEIATQAEFRGRDQLAQLVCQPAPTLPELVEVCRREGQPQELVWQLMTGVTGPALLTSQQVESVLQSLRTTWQFNPLRARQQVEHLCRDYQQKTEALTQSCRELRRQQDLWLPLPKYQRERLNEAVMAEYSLRQQVFGVGLGLTVILGLLAGALMLSGKQARRGSRPPR